MDLLWQDPRGNLSKAVEMIVGADADLVVLPEMFTTGFDVENVCCAEPFDGTTIATLVDIASSTDKAITGSVAVGQQGRYCNRMFFIKPDGSVEWYDKHHLFSYSGEDRLFDRGEERKIVEYRGMRILLEVCYDLRFPVWSRCRGDYDMIIYVASWPASRIGAWDALLAARAIENQAYVIGVNRVGDDPTAHYNGHSAAFDYYGNRIITAPDDIESVEYAVVDTDTLNRFRDKFRAWQDADDFSIEQ